MALNGCLSPLWPHFLLGLPCTTQPRGGLPWILSSSQTSKWRKPLVSLCSDDAVKISAGALECLQSACFVKAFIGAEKLKGTLARALSPVPVGLVRSGKISQPTSEENTAGRPDAAASYVSGNAAQDQNAQVTTQTRQLGDLKLPRRDRVREARISTPRCLTNLGHGHADSRGLGTAKSLSVECVYEAHMYCTYTTPGRVSDTVMDATEVVEPERRELPHAPPCIAIPDGQSDQHPSLMETIWRHGTHQHVRDSGLESRFEMRVFVTSWSMALSTVLHGPPARTCS